MNRDFHRWYSNNLGRDMEMLVFGYSGARVLVFPTSKGRYYEWEDRGMIHSMAEPIERGHIQVFCIDSVDEESWYAAGSGRATGPGVTCSTTTTSYARSFRLPSATPTPS